MAKTFEEWKSDVDFRLEQECGMVSEDLPDYDYQSAFTSGMDPRATAKAAIRAAKE